MRVLIQLKSGRSIRIEEDNIIETGTENIISFYSYTEYDGYYVGNARYRGQKELIRVSKSSVEYIDFRPKDNK